MKKTRKKTFEELARLGPDEDFFKAIDEKSIPTRKRAVRAVKFGKPLVFSCIFSNNRLLAAIEAGADLTALDDREQNILHWAAFCGHSGVISSILKFSNLDINAPAPHGGSPLHIAAARLSVDRVRELLDAGADIKKLNTKGQTPLEVVVESILRKKNEDPNMSREDIFELDTIMEKLTFLLECSPSDYPAPIKKRL